MTGYYMLSTLYHLCVCECVGIMPNDEPLPAWSLSPPPGQMMNPLLHGLSALPQAMGLGFDPSSQEEVLGKIC